MEIEIKEWITCSNIYIANAKKLLPVCWHCTLTSIFSLISYHWTIFVVAVIVIIILISFVNNIYLTRFFITSDISHELWCGFHCIGPIKSHMHDLLCLHAWMVFFSDSQPQRLTHMRARTHVHKWNWML